MFCPDFCSATSARFGLHELINRVLELPLPLPLLMLMLLLLLMLLMLLVLLLRADSCCAGATRLSF